MNKNTQNRRLGVAIATTALLVAVVIALLWGRVFVNKAPHMPMERSSASYINTVAQNQHEIKSWVSL